MGSRNTLRDCSNSLQHATSSPLWAKDAFAPLETGATLPLSGFKNVRHIDDDDLGAMLNAPQPTSCPKEFNQFEYTSKPRPAPIYQDRQNEEYWSFLKSVTDIPTAGPAPPTRCPSLTSGGTLSSRNSSTRSTRSSIWDSIDDWNNNLKTEATIPEISVGAILPLSTCFKEHLAETCPVKTCERHLRGFTRAGDQKRHVFTHFTGTLQCNFCPSGTTSFMQAPDRVGLFLTHLLKHHDVGRQQLDQDIHVIGKSIRSTRKYSVGGPIATCSVCSEPFTSQVLYEHLPGCVLRHVTRDASSGPPNTEEIPTSVLTSLANTIHDETSHCEAEHDPPIHQTCEDVPANVPIAPVKLEYDGVAELTASSRCLSLTSSKAVESSEEETDWTEDTTSRESSPGLPRRLSPAKRRVVDTVMQEFHRLLDHALRTHTTSGSSSNSSRGGYGGWSSNASTYSSSSFISRKRSLSGGGSTPPNDDEETNKRRRPDPKVDGKQPVGELRFACPYYKRNPGRHQTFTSCRDPGFTTVARLKEHLYRRHLLPPQCHRCCTTFSNDTVLREHQRDPGGCEVREQIPLEGFDKDQERRLKSKKRSQNYQSEEDKWKGVYAILFPDVREADMPDPYIEYQPCIGGSSDSSPIQRFQEFSRLELPRLVRRTLEVVVEQEAQPLEETLKERLVDIVKECQTQLVSMFQATTIPSTTNTTTGLEGVRSAPCLETAAIATSSLTMAMFQGFDSLPVRITPISHEPDSTWLSTPRRGTAHLLEVSSGSPDSGYDSNWTSTTRLPELAPSTGLDLTFADTMPQSESELVDLGGYYDLFQDRNGFMDQTMSRRGETIQAAWPFIEAEPSMTNASSISLDSLDAVGLDWGV